MPFRIKMKKTKEVIIYIQNFERNEKLQKRDKGICMQRCLKRNPQFLHENEFIKNRILYENDHLMINLKRTKTILKFRSLLKYKIKIKVRNLKFYPN